MTSQISSLQQSLQAVGAETVRRPPDEVRTAIKNRIDGAAVGVPLERSDITVPENVHLDPTPNAVREATTGVTPAKFGIVDYGSIVLPVKPTGSELVSLFVDNHIAVLDAEAIVPDMDSAHERFHTAIPGDYGSAIIATGPSATADMGALVQGAHGPRDVHVVIVED